MKLFRRIWPYAVLVVLLVVNSFVWMQRENIADWWRLRGYDLPRDIAALADDTTMTDYAERMFYINHPSLETKEAFNQHCADHGEETSVLGCYHGDRQGIYLYAVDDSRLEGVRQVTAAHEMLHQAYDRLGDDERKRIDNMLTSFFDSAELPKDVKAKIDSYKDQKDADLVNEMHSIFGSEVRALPDELETYYKRYFDDRLKVVGFSEAYRAEFTRRKALVAQYDTQLDDLKAQIDTNKQELESKSDYLNTKEEEIKQDVKDRSQAAYQADVKDYNTMVDAYNAQLAKTRQLIEEHNDIVKKRNAIAIQEQELQKALDSRLEPSTKQ
jgi:hypothetical protein